ncbi:MAG: PEP-CTERM sorting domain-containing protein [Gemmatimonadaceae bacterium]|nr:PEP-CTERM sorting domain-containing protein [Gemmatimonadaceae bacterium]
MRHRLSLLATATLLLATTAPAQIVNIDSRYGYTNAAGNSNPAPVPGEHVTLLGSPLQQLTLGPGTYRVTNAWGQMGALHRAWSYNTTTNGWGWAFLIVNDDTRNVIKYFEAGRGSSEAEVAALAEVQDFTDFFTLLTTTTIDFTLRDYYLPDNAGGISVLVTPVSDVVPEPATVGLLGAGLVVTLVGGRRRLRQRAV